MEPVTMIAIAKSIAGLTGLDDWLQKKMGNAFGEKAAQHITDIAMAATGTTAPQDALKVIEQSPEYAVETRRQIMQNEHEIALAVFEDRQSARDMYKHRNETADTIAGKIIRENIWLVAAMVAANCLVLYFVKDSVVAVAIGNLIGASVAALWQERQQVMNFYFGSSLGSKLKDGGNKKAV